MCLLLARYEQVYLELGQACLVKHRLGWGIPITMYIWHKMNGLSGGKHQKYYIQLHNTL